MVKDLTVGKPLNKIFSIFMPMMLTTVFQQLYNIVDTMIVGKLISKNALAAVSLTGSLNWMLLSFIIGFASAESVLVSAEFGKHDFKKMKTCIANGIYVVSFVGVLMTVISALLCKTFLGIINTPKDIFDDTFTYFFVVILGFPFCVCSNYIASIMHSVGNSKPPMLVGIVSTLVNLALDLIFVICFGWNVFGVAFATFIAQVVSAGAYIFIYLKSFPELYLSKENFKLDKKVIIKTLSLGLPMGLQSSITMLGCTLIQSAVNSLGTVYVAAYNTALKIETLLSTPIMTFTGATVPFIAQNFGAEKFDRIKKALKQIIVICVSYGALIGLTFFLFGEKIALMYINSNEIKTLELIGYYAVISGPLYTLLCLLYAVRNYIQALGYSLFTAIGGVIELLTRAVISFGLISHFGFTMICWSNPLSWIFTNLFLIMAYIFYIKKKVFVLKDKINS